MWDVWGMQEHPRAVVVKWRVETPLNFEPFVCFGGFEFEIDFESAVVLDGNFFLLNAGFAVMGLDGVFAGRQAVDGEIAVRIADGKKWVLDHVHVGEFPGMHVAFEAHE